MRKADSEAQPFVNAPAQTCEFLRFQTMIRKLCVLGLQLTKTSRETKVTTKVVTKKTKDTDTVTEEESVPKTVDDYYFDFQIPQAEKKAEKIQLLATTDIPTKDIPTKPTGFVLLRSPEAMIFYLGELIEVQNKAKETYTPAIILGPAVDRAERVLLLVQRGTPSADAILCVDHEQENYCIPRGVHRSMHALSLVSQILAQQQKAEALPVTPTVRVIGQ